MAADLLGAGTKLLAGCIGIRYGSAWYWWRITCLLPWRVHNMLLPLTRRWFIERDMSS